MPMGSSNKSDRYLSEDYAFCQLARHIDIPIHLCPWMKLGHIGTYVFDGSMADLGRIDSSNPMARAHQEQSQKLREARIKVEEEAQAVKQIEQLEEKKSTRQEEVKILFPF
jgi:hypothetical protein